MTTTPLGNKHIEVKEHRAGKQLRKIYGATYFSAHWHEGTRHHHKDGDQDAWEPKHNDFFTREAAEKFAATLPRATE